MLTFYDLPFSISRFATSINSKGPVSKVRAYCNLSSSSSSLSFFFFFLRKSPLKSLTRSAKWFDSGSLKKWRNFANSSRTVTNATTTSPNRSGIHKSISFLKGTISSPSSDSDDRNHNKKHSSGNSNAVPKGHLAVCVGEELERFVIPMYYLGHPAFGFLLREPEEVFGFQQTGVLQIPCDVSVFQSVLAMVEGKKKSVKNGSLVVKEQCRFSADETFGCLLLDGGEMGHSHLDHSRHHPWNPIC